MLPPYITPQSLQKLIEQALAEDVGTGDYTSLATIPPHTTGRARLIFKQNGIAAGVELSKYIFDAVDKDLMVEYFVKDGDFVQNTQTGLTVQGSVHSILKAERLVLNCMQRMSGIATLTHGFQQKIAHTKAKVLDTRKTTPNFRMLEKWAVLIGGGENHRYGLFDMILIKDNHIDYAGGVKQAVNNTLDYLQRNNLDLKIVVETRNVDEVAAALDTQKVYRILLDNMNIEQLREAVTYINGRCLTEASGGVNLETIAAIAETGVDYISVGALTHSYTALDISLKAF